MRVPAHSSDHSRLRAPAHRPSLWDRICLPAAASVLLFALVYGCWRFGGVQVEAQYHLTIIAGIAIAFVFLAKTPVQSILPSSASRPLFIGAGLLAWYGLQILPIPTEVVHAVSPGAKQIRAVYLGDDTPSLSTLSVVPSLSVQSIALYLLMAVFFVLSCAVFANKSSRLMLLIGIAANAACITFWGLVQRISGSRQLVPGSEKWEGANSFATFVNQNGGGVAVALGLAAAIGLFLWSAADRGWILKRNSLRAGELIAAGGYSGRGYLFHPPLVASFVLIVFLIVGVIASLSRGVWLSAGLGLGAIVFVAVTAARWQVVMGTLVLAALGVVGVVQLYDQLTGKIIEKSHRFSESALFEDARWEHWSDSWRLAQTYFPVGAGIGTYPYAQLDQQQHEQAGWLKQAHNQYLETFAEGGVIAIVLVLAMFGYALQSSWRLFTGATSGEQLGMGAMGAMVLMIAFFHSFVDFVIAMPANLLALALIAGAVLTAGEQTAMRDFRFRSVRRLGIWCVAALLCGIASERMLYRSVAVEKTLTASVLPERADPSLSTCAAMIQKIEAALPITGQQYAILQRLAAWQALKSAQIHKQSESTERNASIAAVWANLLSVGIQSLQHATTDHPVLSVRDATVLESAVGHLRDANRDNPFVAQSHLLQAQVLGVLGDSQWRLSAERSRRISKLNPELFFINGLMAYASNDDSVMIEEFQRCLRFSSRFDTAITAVALEKLSPRELANELLPDEPEVVVRFIGNANPTSPLAQERSTLIERAKRLLKEPRTTSDYQMLASLAQFEGNAEQSIAYLRTAVETDPRDSRLRMELANQLLALNKFDAAFEQTTLARSLGANQASVVALQKQILHKSNINQLIHKNTEAAP